MGKLVNYVTSLHKSTKRNYLERMCDEKVHCMDVAKEFEKDYWDGDRRYGYGGYKYIEGRGKSVAESLIKNYNLTNHSSILDIGCGKGFLLYEIKLLLPDINISGIDISTYGVKNSKEEVRDKIKVFDVKNKLPFKDKQFDLSFSLNCIHNLKIFDLGLALSEMQRVSKKSYLLVDSIRSSEELFNLQCWALTCQSFYTPEEWVWLFDNNKFTGDYEFIYF